MQFLHKALEIKQLRHQIIHKYPFLLLNIRKNYKVTYEITYLKPQRSHTSMLKQKIDANLVLLEYTVVSEGKGSQTTWQGNVCTIYLEIIRNKGRLPSGRLEISAKNWAMKLLQFC